MRDEKERMGIQIQSLQHQQKSLETQVKDQLDFIKELEEQDKQKQQEIYSKERIISDKDTELLFAKNDVEKAKAMTADRQATLEAYRQQLDESYLKCKSLQDANNKLQLTLRDTQDELDRFVKQYETLT